MAWQLFYIHFETMNAIPYLIACRSYLSCRKGDIAGGLPPACRRESRMEIGRAAGKPVYSFCSLPSIRVP